MVTVKDLLEKLIRAEAKIDSDFEAIMKIVETEILELNREEQLFEKGIGTDGRLLGVYSKATESMTEGARGVGFPKRAGEPYNFYNTGEMFKSFDLKVGNDSFSIFNTSKSLKEFSKTKNISEDRIIGLTLPNQKKIELERIMPLLREFFKRNIN